MGKLIHLCIIYILAVVLSEINCSTITLTKKGNKSISNITKD